MPEVADYPGNDRLAQALTLVQGLPPLSPMVRHLLASVSAPDDGASLAEIAGLIEKDPVTAGRVLALANSAFYARAIPVLSVRHAVSQLGLNAIRNLVLSVSLSGFGNRVPTPAAWSTSRFNTHSIATAILSETIASALAPEKMELAFLAGLFHDLGRLIIAVLLRDEGKSFQRLLETEHDGLEQAELDLLGFTHPVLSAAIVASWKLPAAIEMAVRFHENPFDDPDRALSPSVPLCDIVHVADCYADHQGLSISGEKALEEQTARALDELGLGIDDADILPQFQDQLEVLMSIL
ncbi:MAG TPA: HDOD domain-containing protein [Bryobacteraceae bacterium]|nr:HDOD domain-containing protein [Bryobacteraceae bacterium]